MAVLLVRGVDKSIVRSIKQLCRQPARRSLADLLAAV
jgi:hypothetical protein